MVGWRCLVTLREQLVNFAIEYLQMGFPLWDGSKLYSCWVVDEGHKQWDEVIFLNFSALLRICFSVMISLLRGIVTKGIATHTSKESTAQRLLGDRVD